MGEATTIATQPSGLFSAIGRSLSRRTAPQFVKTLVGLHQKEGVRDGALENLLSCFADALYRFVLVLSSRPKLGDEARRACSVSCVLVAKLRCHFSFLCDRQPRVHEHEYREHEERQHRRPLNQKAEQDRDETYILWMPDSGVRSGSRETTRFLRLVQHLPCFRQ